MNLRRLLLAGALTALTLAVFIQVRDFDFVSWDDPAVITTNPMVRRGLTWEGVRWAFTTDYFTHYWQPLSWISHQVDVTLFGLDPGRFHLVNLALHCLNAVLLFLALEAFTGVLGPSALVAALFAVHPLHVESVAWITERRDVLSTLFLLLAILAYRRYLERPSAGRHLAVLLCAALAIMAKPMAVTLPLLLLLLDFWPAGRFLPESGGPGSRRSRLWPLAEKIPLASLALGAAVLTVAWNLGWSQQSYPFRIRLGNAFYSYAQYLRTTVWPAGLAYFYPHPGFSLTLSRVAPAALLLLALTALSAWQARRRPALLTGWIWFLGGLLPVIGLVRAGNQGRGDHFTYLPLVGLFIAAAWGGVAAPLRRIGRVAPAIAALALVGALAWASRVQTGFWRNTLLLTRHALEVTEGNWVAHGDYGRALLGEGRVREAAPHFAAALRARPGDSAAMYNSLLVAGMIHEEEGDRHAALDAYSRLERHFPHEPEVLARLGYLLSVTGRAQEAAAVYERLVGLVPGDPAHHYNLGVNLARTGRSEEAIRRYREAIRLRPAYHQARTNLAAAFFDAGRLEEAGAEYREALRLDPGDVVAACGLGQVLARQGNRDEAVTVYRRALERAPGDERLGALLRQALAAPPSPHEGAAGP